MDEAETKQGDEAPTYTDVVRIGLLAEANGLRVEDIVEIALNGGFSLITPLKTSGVWEPTEHAENFMRAIRDHGEIDPTDPEAAQLLVREWAYVRVIQWAWASDSEPFPLNHSWVGPDEGFIRPATAEENARGNLGRAMASKQVVWRAQLAVRESGVPSVWFGGGALDCGLKLPPLAEAEATKLPSFRTKAEQAEWRARRLLRSEPDVYFKDDDTPNQLTLADSMTVKHVEVQGVVLAADGFPVLNFASARQAIGKRLKDVRRK